jgi:hypothetical protein
MAGSTRLGAHTHREQDVTILTGAAVSNGVDLGGGTLVGFLCPATLDNTAFDVQVSFDNGTNFYDVDTLKSLTATVNEVTHINPADSIGMAHVRLQGASNETTGGTDRTIKLIYVPVV